jgi:4-methoxybenzoate monooxygenase (O-demethylating)
MIDPGISSAGEVPSLDVDPFSDGFLSDPYAHYHELRDAGPVTWLSRYGVFAMARYHEVSAALKDWGTFCSGRGVGMSDFARETPWRPPSLLLETDPPLHEKTRAVVGRTLSVNVLRALRPAWQAAADALVDKLVARQEFDAIGDLAQAYPLRVFPDAVGLREEGRENLLPYGSLAFNAFGPRNQRTEDAMSAAAPIVDWVAQSCKRQNLKVGGFGMGIFDAVGPGEITEEEAERLVRSLLTAGVDTTVNGIGNMLGAFLCHPVQWALLKKTPSLVRRVFDESVRWDSTVQTFFRTTTCDTVMSGIHIPKDTKVLLFLAAANHDPRQWEHPEQFNVERLVRAHVGFGAGIHACIGQAVARMEAEAVLNALLRRVDHFEPAGRPERRLNNTLHAWSSMPVRALSLE